jgi:hypothetical protein
MIVNAWKDVCVCACVRALETRFTEENGTVT